MKALGITFDRKSLLRPPRDYWDLLRESVSSWRFDRRLRIRSRGKIELRDLGIPTPGYFQYQATPVRDMQAVLAKLDIGSQDTFVDFGCGMGRAVVIAATYSFKRVIGVDIAEALCSIARDNIERARPRLACRDVRIVAADITTYEVPRDATHLYFFNPCSSEFFNRAIENARRSYCDWPRRCRVIYYGARGYRGHTEFLSACDWLVLKHEMRFPLHRGGWIYETN